MEAMKRLKATTQKHPPRSGAESSRSWLSSLLFEQPFRARRPFRGHAFPTQYINRGGQRQNSGVAIAKVESRERAPSACGGADSPEPTSAGTTKKMNLGAMAEVLCFSPTARISNLRPPAH